MPSPPPHLDDKNHVYHQVADQSYVTDMSQGSLDDSHPSISNGDRIRTQESNSNQQQPAPPITSSLGVPATSATYSSPLRSDIIFTGQRDGSVTGISDNGLNRNASKSARIHINTGSQGPTITVSQPPVSPVDSTAAISPITTEPRQRTGIQRANHPGQISLEGLRPQMPDMHEGNAQCRTGVVNVEGNDHTRLAALAEELEDEDSEAFSDAPPPGHVIIRDEAFLGGQPTNPQELRERDPQPAYDYGGTTTPGATSSGSYDPMDDLDHVDIIEGETDGMPSKPPRSARKKVYDQGKKGWGSLRRIFGINSNENKEDLSEKGLFTSDATNMKSVPVQTSSGLRGTKRRHRPSAIEREAAKLVSAHKMLHGRGADSSDEDEMHLPGFNRSHLPDSEASTPDALETAQQMDSRPVESGGVLGQLLKLYDQQQTDGTSQVSDSQAPESEAATEPDVTELGGGLNLIGNEVVDAYGNHAAIQDVDPEVLKQAAESKPSTDSWRDSSRYSLQRSGAGLINLANQNIVNVSNAGQSVVKNVASDVGLDIMDERPKAARSAAGTIGGLIATSGNLIGAVSPLHAQLGPNPSRPGFTLDRYLLPDMNEKTLRRTAKIVAEASPVPKKMRTGPTGTVPLTPNTFAAYVQQDSGVNPYFSAAESKSIAGSATASSMKRRGQAIGNAGKNLMHRKWPHGSMSDDEQNHLMNTNPEELARREWKKKLRRRKARSKKQEIFITMHVAAILKRQEFLLKLSRCLMMFGAPTHRIEQQIQATANVLEVNCRCVYFPSVMLLSFGDENTHTSETKIIKQGSTVDLTKLTDMHTIYWNVIHDKIGVEQGSKQLDNLMRRKPMLRKWQFVLVSGLASAFITVGEWAFNGSLLDAIASFCLGSFMSFCQLSITSELYSNVFEIVFATLNSFIAMGLHQISRYHTPTGEIHYGRYFCYEAVMAGSIVMILPGFIVLTAALELQSKSLVSGSVRLVYAIIYSTLLGLGIMIGALPLLGSEGANLTKCNARKLDFPHWYNTPPGQNASPSFAWAFLTVPGYALLLSLRNQAKVTRKEFPAMVLIAVCGWLVANFATIANKVNSSCNGTKDEHCPVPEVLQNHSYLYSALGSFTVGILANIYGRFFDGRSFVVAVPGILFQLPSGMTGSTTLWNFATLQDDGSGSGNTEVTSGLQIGAQLLNISLGIAIGLFASSLLMFFLGGHRVRGGGMFSF